MVCLTKAHLTVRTCHLLGTQGLVFQVCFDMKTAAHLQTLWRSMHCSVGRREQTFFCFSLAVEAKWLCRSSALVPAFSAQIRKIDLNYQAARYLYSATTFYAHDAFTSVFVLCSLTKVKTGFCCFLTISNSVTSLFSVREFGLRSVCVFFFCIKHRLTVNLVHKEVCLRLKSSGMITMCVNCVCGRPLGHMKTTARASAFNVSKWPCCIPSIPPKLLRCL